jgi:anti-sigma regulatory factor (Ser/Thr protein kinase)
VADFVLKIHNDFDNLPAAADATAQFLERNGASSDVVFAANLAIEEIVSNIIKYGYHDALKHEITVRLALLERTLEIEICDDGGEFNPFNQPESDASSEARQIGGLGIHLVRNMLDTCSYERRDGQNIVKLSKKL